MCKNLNKVLFKNAYFGKICFDFTVFFANCMCNSASRKENLAYVINNYYYQTGFGSLNPAFFITEKTKQRTARYQQKQSSDMVLTIKHCS